MIEISDNFKEIVSENALVVIDMYSPTCGPCKMMEPMIEKVEMDNRGVVFGKVNIMENANLASEFNVTSVPTIIFFQYGKEVKRITGAQPRAKVEELFK